MSQMSQMTQIKFWRGDFQKYSSRPKDKGVVYFVTNIPSEKNPDIFFSGIFIGDNLIASSQQSDIDLDALEGIIGNLEDINDEFKDLTLVEIINFLLDNINSSGVFNPGNIPDEYVIPPSYERLSYKDVKGKGVDEIIEMMFFPDILPEVTTQPNLNIEMTKFSTFKEIGAKFSPTVVSYFNRGTIECPNFEYTRKRYAGNALNISLFINDEFICNNIPVTKMSYTDDEIKDFENKRNVLALTINEYEIISGTNTWKTHVIYGSSDIDNIPISSKMKEHKELSCVQDESSSRTITIYGVYPILSNKDDINYLQSKEELVHNTTKVFTIKYLSPNDETHRFKIASEINSGREELESIELMNNLSKNFVTQKLNIFKQIDNEIIILNGKEVEYMVWECTETALGANATFRFTFK